MDPVNAFKLWIYTTTAISVAYAFVAGLVTV